MEKLAAAMSEVSDPQKAGLLEEPMGKLNLANAEFARWATAHLNDEKFGAAMDVVKSVRAFCVGWDEEVRKEV